MSEPSPTYTADHYLEVEVTSLHPSPLNSRRHVDPAYLEGLAASIRAAGLIQPITVRPREDGGYWIVAGECRFRAVQALGWAVVSCRVMEDMTDLEHRRLALTENLQRNDLNPIDRAASFRALLDAGESQSGLAASLGIAQETIANSIRLLGLPPAVQTMIATDHLTPSAGKALLRWPSAAAQNALADYAMRNHLTTRQLETDALPQGVLDRLERDRQVVWLRDYGSTPVQFDVGATCGSCQSYRNTAGQRICFRPACFRETNERAIQEREARLREARAALAVPPLSPTPFEGEPPSPATETADTPAGVLSAERVPRELYRCLPTPPFTGCDPTTCPQARRLLPRDGAEESEAVLACFDHDCFQTLRAAEDQAEIAARQTRADELEEACLALLPREHGQMNPADLRLTRTAIVALWRPLVELVWIHPADWQDGLQRLGITLEIDPQEFAFAAGQREQQQALFRALDTLPASYLLSLVAWLTLRTALDVYRHGSGQLPYPLTWFLNPDDADVDPAPIVPIPAAPRPTCRACQNCEVPEPGDEEAEPGQGFCLYRMQTVPLEQPACHASALPALAAIERDLDDAGDTLPPVDAEEPVFQELPEEAPADAPCLACGLIDCTCGATEDVAPAPDDPANTGFCRYCAGWRASGKHATATMGACTEKGSPFHQQPRNPFTVACPVFRRHRD